MRKNVLISRGELISGYRLRAWTETKERTREPRDFFYATMARYQANASFRRARKIKLFSYTDLSVHYGVSGRCENGNIFPMLPTALANEELPFLWEHPEERSSCEERETRDDRPAVFSSNEQWRRIDVFPFGVFAWFFRTQGETGDKETGFPASRWRIAKQHGRCSLFDRLFHFPLTGGYWKFVQQWAVTRKQQSTEKEASEITIRAS